MPQHTILIADTGESFPCAENQSLLHGMSRLGRKGIPQGCYGGGCGVCKIQVLSGHYHTRKMSRDQVTADEEQAGYALACRTFAETDLTLRVVGKLRKAFAR